VTEFFEDHTVMASSRALNKARDSIESCANLRATQEPNLKQWLQTGE